MEGRLIPRLFRSYVTLKSNIRCLSLSCSHYTETKTEYEQHSKQTHFGFQTVPEEVKEEKVYEVFSNVAEKYDLMNDVMSGGVHRLWKDYFLEKLGPVPGTKLIDVAGGTGDIAFRFLSYLENIEEEESEEIDEMSDEIGKYPTQRDVLGQSLVTVCDINQAMLDVGKKRAEALGHTHSVSWLKGNAECLPVTDNSYDAYTIAFGIRNTTHINKVLTEAYRVLKPGGRFMCLEFSEVTSSILRKLYDEYSFQVIPVMGKVVAGDWHSYQYLVESIRKFPKQDEFAKMIREAGFRAVHYENLMMGIAAIHSGFKL